MNIAVDDRELIELKNSAGKSVERTRKQAVAAVRESSFAVEILIKEQMPVDTGRARASWGHWTGGVKGGEGGAGDAHWEVLDGGLTIEQGSNVPYIVFLNAGTSKQAALGFIDRGQAKGQLELERELELIDPLSAREISLLGASTAGSGNF